MKYATHELQKKKEMKPTQSHKLPYKVSIANERCHPYYTALIQVPQEPQGPADPKVTFHILSRPLRRHYLPDNVSANRKLTPAFSVPCWVMSCIYDEFHYR